MINCKNINSIKIILVFFAIFLVGCQKGKIEGCYFNIEQQQIYEFTSSKLFLYDLNDSIKKKYSLSIVGNKIEIKTKHNQIKLDFSMDQDTLWIIDNKQGFLYQDEIELIKFEYHKLKNHQLVSDNYWHIKSFNQQAEFWFKFNLNTKKEDGSVYISQKKSNRKELNTFDIQQKVYFNKFKIISFKTYILNNSKCLLTEVTKDSLTLKSLRSFQEIKMKSYKSKMNNFLHGAWINVGAHENHSTFFDFENKRFYFGDTIIFSKDNSFISESNYKNNELDIINEQRTNKVSMSFKIGLDTENIYFDKPIDNVLFIEKLTNDSLIFLNPYFNVKMKYIRKGNNVY